MHLAPLAATGLALALLLVTPPAGRAVLVTGEGLNEPFGVSFDSAGRVYIVEMGGNRVTVLGRDGKRSVLAGTGEKAIACDEGPAATVRFNGPHHLLMGPDGHLYVADTFNNCVRRIDLETRMVTRVAGTGEKGFGGDVGPAREARFGGIYAIAFRGNVLFACDLDNRRVRAIDLKTGVVTTVAGTSRSTAATTSSSPTPRTTSSAGTLRGTGPSAGWPARERRAARASGARRKPASSTARTEPWCSPGPAPSTFPTARTTG